MSALPQSRVDHIGVVFKTVKHSMNDDQIAFTARFSSRHVAADGNITKICFFAGNDVGIAVVKGDGTVAYIGSAFLAFIIQNQRVYLSDFLKARIFYGIAFIFSK